MASESSIYPPPAKRFSPLPDMFPEEESYHQAVPGMDDSLSSSNRRSLFVSASCQSLSTEGSRSVTIELEERVQMALEEDSADILKDTDIQESMITQEDIDALCSGELLDLSFQEREDILYDIHGVGKVIEETPEFCQQQIQLLEQELKDRIEPRRHQLRGTVGAYCMALQQNVAYVQSCQWMFLRASRWKPKEAADGMIGFFHRKWTLFGPHALTERITIEKHLSKADRQALESGFFQLLPVRDTAGRAIVAAIPPLRNYQDPDNLRRAFYYIVMTALEDVETQRNGIIIVGYNIGMNRVVDRKAAFAIQSMKRILPMRLVSIHYCYDDIPFRVMMTVAMLMMGATRRVRLRAHFGTCQDVLYKLSTFGIPCAALPVAQDGEPKFKNHRRWLKDRSHQEMLQIEGMLPQLIIVVPNRCDVLLGRGKPIQEHFGNLRFNSLVGHFQGAYDKSVKFQKMKISQHIIDTVTEYGGRFLKQEAAGWVEADVASIREKVGHAFRTHRGSSSIASPGSSLSTKTTTTTSSSPIVDATSRTTSDQWAMDPILELLPSFHEVVPDDPLFLMADSHDVSTTNDRKRLR